LQDFSIFGWYSLYGGAQEEVTGTAHACLASGPMLVCGLGDPERLCTQQTGVRHTGRGVMPTIELESPAERQYNVVRFCHSAEKLRMRGIRVPDQFANIFLEHYWHNPD